MLQTSPTVNSTPKDKESISPVLVVMLIVLAVYPFIVGFLPEPVRQYLGSLLR